MTWRIVAVKNQFSNLSLNKSITIAINNKKNEDNNPTDREMKAVIYAAKTVKYYGANSFR